MRTNQKSATGVDVSKSIVLVVDDNPANLEIIANYLQDQGLEAAIAGNGEIALKRVKHLQPDLILLDVLMPGIDGFETCRKLKEDEDTRDIPVIFMTSLTDNEYRRQGFLVGGVDYIAKPIHYEEMYARVKTHLEIRQYRGTSGGKGAEKDRGTPPTHPGSGVRQSTTETAPSYLHDGPGQH